MGREAEVDVVEMKAVETSGVEFHDFRQSAGGDETQAVHSFDAGYDRPVIDTENVDLQLRLARSGVGDDAVQMRQAGAEPGGVDEAAGAGKAEQVEMSQTCRDLAGEIGVEDQYVVVREDKDVAAALIDTPVVALGQRARVVDADDFGGMAGQQRFVAFADAGEFGGLDTADDDREFRRVHELVP